MSDVVLRVHGMDCAEEIITLKAEVGTLAGVQDLSFDLLNSKMTVQYDGEVIGPDGLVAAIRKTGMRAERYEAAPEIGGEGTPWKRWGRSILTGASGILVAAGAVSHSLSEGWTAVLESGEGASAPLATRVFYLLSVVAGTWFVAPKAWLALKRLRPDMNLLMSIAVVGAICLGEYFEAATVAFLFALSLALESWSVARARNAVAALMAVAPQQARVLGEDRSERLVRVEDVPVGGRVIVKPGEKVPVDGRIVRGTTTVDQAPITGESMPVAREAGQEVFAGSLNQDGAIEIETLKPASDSTVSRIIKLVHEAQSRRSPSEQWVERFARYYTPVVMALALGVAVALPLVLGNWGKWFYEALVLLVIACPCALVISTPVSIVAALTAAARKGVLIKGGVFVEIPARLKAIAMDKTGTLTEGRPVVVRLIPLAGHTELELLEIVAAIEMRSEHPLAQAIVRHAAERGIKPHAVEGYQAIKGKGAVALLDGRPVWIGSHRYLEERGVETPEMHARLEDLASGGQSIVVVGEEDHVCGFVALADRLRPNAKAAIAELKRLGIERVIMITGDNEPTARAIARESGVDEYRAEVLPEEKVKVVEGLVNLHGTVAMVGDGVNDAPALARSSVGIAMGAGTAAAIETADIALMSDDLSRLPWLVHHARRTLGVIRQNIAASLLVKAAFMLLTFLGRGSLGAAIAADMGVSLLVVFNALRLLKGAER